MIAKWQTEKDRHVLMCGAMNDFVRQELTQWLGTLVSEISEGGYCAGWYSGCEDMIPSLCIAVAADGRDRDFGMFTIKRALAVRMCGIAESLGHWVDLGDMDDPFEYKAYRPRFARDRQAAP